MQDQFNPYAAPATVAMHPRAAEWLQTPQDPSLQKVATGLGFIYLSILIILLTAILFFVVTMVWAGGAGQRVAQGGNPQVVVAEARTLGMIGLAAGLAMIVGYVLNVVGTFMCLATPAESGAKGWITASATLMVMSILMQISAFFIRDRETARVVSGIQPLMTIAGGICFLVFLKRLAQFIGSERLTRRAQKILTLLVVGFAMTVIMVALIVTGNLWAALLVLVLLIGGLIVFAMYANLLVSLKNAIRGGGAV
jgi:hypothetical protein